MPDKVNVHYLLTGMVPASDVFCPVTGVLLLKKGTELHDFTIKRLQFHNNLDVFVLNKKDSAVRQIGSVSFYDSKDEEERVYEKVDAVLDVDATGRRKWLS